jgi:hypothetical protein
MGMSDRERWMARYGDWYDNDAERDADYQRYLTERENMRAIFG